jgi:hypothetical protein
MLFTLDRLDAARQRLPVKQQLVVVVRPGIRARFIVLHGKKIPQYTIDSDGRHENVCHAQVTSEQTTLDQCLSRYSSTCANIAQRVTCRPVGSPRERLST